MIKTIKLSKTNCYLISIDKGYLLIDTGYKEDKTKFFKELSNQQIELNEIRFLFLTHHHDDHAGMLNDLIEQNPDIRVILNKGSVELLKNGVNTRDFGGAWCSKRMKKAAEFYRLINKKWTLSFPPYFIRETDLILPNEDFNLRQIVGINLRAIYSPGHSIDSISLLDENMNLFCGDAAADYLRILGTRYAPPFITDLSQFYTSWQKFIDLGVKQVYPSHGNLINIGKIKKNIHLLTKDGVGEFIWD